MGGVTQGIGLQIAKDLAAKKGVAVLLGARSIERGEAAATAVGSGARALQLDVTDAKSIASAAVLDDDGPRGTFLDVAALERLSPPPSTAKTTTRPKAATGRRKQTAATSTKRGRR